MEGSVRCSDDCIRDGPGNSENRERRDMVNGDEGRGGEMVGRVCREWWYFLDVGAWFMSVIDVDSGEIGRSSCLSSSPATLDPERVPSSAKVVWMDACERREGSSSRV